MATTKRSTAKGYGWIKAGLVATSFSVALTGAHYLAAADAAATAASMPTDDEQTVTLTLPAPSKNEAVSQGAAAGIVIELAPVPTLVAPAQVAAPRPVVRSRSSR